MCLLFWKLGKVEDAPLWPFPPPISLIHLLKGGHLLWLVESILCGNQWPLLCAASRVIGQQQHPLGSGCAFKNIPLELGMPSGPGHSMAFTHNCRKHSRCQGIVLLQTLASFALAKGTWIGRS